MTRKVTELPGCEMADSCEVLALYAGSGQAPIEGEYVYGCIASFDVQSTKSGDRKILTMSTDPCHHAMAPLDLRSRLTVVH